MSFKFWLIFDSNTETWLSNEVCSVRRSEICLNNSEISSLYSVTFWFSDKKFGFRSLFSQGCRIGDRLVMQSGILLERIFSCISEFPNFEDWLLLRTSLHPLFLELEK